MSYYEPGEVIPGDLAAGHVNQLNEYAPDKDHPVPKAPLGFIWPEDPDASE